MNALIEARGNLHMIASIGMTPLCMAAFEGHLQVVKVLLAPQQTRFGAQQILRGGSTSAQLGMAAGEGHSEVVRERTRQDRMEGCGGASGGGNALEVAARADRVESLM